MLTIQVLKVVIYVARSQSKNKQAIKETRSTKKKGASVGEQTLSICIGRIVSLYICINDLHIFV